METTAFHLPLCIRLDRAEIRPLEPAARLERQEIGAPIHIRKVRTLMGFALIGPCPDAPQDKDVSGVPQSCSASGH